jgi:glutathione S-transferase
MSRDDFGGSNDTSAGYSSAFLHTTNMATALGEKPYLDGDTFTAGDLMMASVLRSLEGKNMLERYPNLVAYLARCLGRQGFRDALAAQMADFEQATRTPPVKATAWTML